VANVIAFYVIGLPMAWLMSYRIGFGVDGLLMGISFGSGFQAIVLLTLIKCKTEYMFSSRLVTEMDNPSKSAEVQIIDKESKETNMLQMSEYKLTSLEGSDRFKQFLSPSLPSLEMIYRKVKSTEEDLSLNDKTDDVEEIVF